VDRQEYKVTQVKKVELKERDGLTTRNSMAAIAYKGKVVMFGGQDSEKQVLYNELYTIDTTKGYEIKHVQYGDGEIAPIPRNSHVLAPDGEGAAYMFGGANQEGPRRDLMKLDLDTLRFSNIKVQETEKVKLPSLEMHTAHVYQGKKLLILGGRGMFPGQTVEEAAFQDDIYSVDVETGDLEIFGKLPSDLASHQSALIDDQFIVMYGGTNGLRFFDSVIRYSIPDKKWTLMTKQPKHCKSSRFF
jgi:N-acetylneuraminic acid mutarotase